MKKIAPYWKAIIGFLAPAATVLAVAVTPGSDAGTAITQAELITAGCAAVVTGAGVYAKGNALTKAQIAAAAKLAVPVRAVRPAAKKTARKSAAKKR